MARKVQAKYEITAEDKTKAAVASAQKGLDNVRSAARSVGTALAGLGVALSFKAILDNTIRQEAALAQVEARIRSTGGAAGFTRDELAAMASELQTVTTYGDEAVLEMQSLLLTFTKVTGDVFGQATELILDMSTAMGSDLKASALQVGKALNDPVKGVSALAEAGIQFSAAQKRTIEQLVKTGDVAAAQGIILAELETQFGGAARAARNTFGGALRALGNAFGDLLEGGGGGLNDARDSLEEFTRILQDPNTVSAANTLISGLITGFSKVVEIVSGLNLLLFGPSDPLLKIDDQLIKVQDSIKSMEAELARTRNPRAIETITRALELQRAEAARLKKAYDDLAQARAGKLFGTPRNKPAASPSSDAIAFTVPPVDTTRAELDKQATLLRDALARQQQDLDRAYQEGLTTTAAYFAQRAKLQEASIDAELARLRGQLAVAREEERKAAAETADTEAEAARNVQSVTKAREQQIGIIGQITVLERDRAAIAGQAARDQASAERELAAQLDRVRQRLLELTGETAEARRQALEAEYKTLVQRLQAEGDAQGESLVRRLINVEVARARLDQIQQEVDLAFERMSTAEQSLQAQRDAGIVSEAQSRRELIELHQQTADEVRRLIPLMHELAAATGDPFAVERVKQLEIRLQQLALTADDTALAINASLEQGLSTMLEDIATGTKNAKDAFRDFARSVINDMAKIASQQLAAQIFGSFGGGQGGGIGGAILGAFGLLKHSGGLVGEGSTGRRIPALAFAGAPRYHGGGIAGLAPDEVPAILRKREEVLTEDDPRHRYNLGDGQPAQSRSLKVVLVSDDREALNQLRSSEGDEVLVERLSRNRSAVLGALGLR